MKMSATTVRRGLYGMFAGGLLAFGSAAILAPTANAQPAPGPGSDESCSVSAISTASSAVSASTSTYLASNPEVNDALTDIATQSPYEVTQSYSAYFAAHPEVESQLRTINEPVANLQSQCGVEVAPTPMSAALNDA